MALYRMLKRTQKAGKAEDEKYLKPDHLRRLLAAIIKWGHSNRHRDYWLVYIAGALGLRVSEVCELRPSAFSNLDENVVRISSKKKGGPQVNVIGVDDGTKKKVQTFLAWHKENVQSDWLFPSPIDPKKHLTTRMARYIFDYHCRRAGLPRGYSFHALRHFYGVALWGKTRDLEFVRRQMRHKRIGTTGVYMHMGVEELAERSKQIGPVV